MSVTIRKFGVLSSDKKARKFSTKAQAETYAKKSGGMVVALPQALYVVNIKDIQGRRVQKTFTDERKARQFESNNNFAGAVRYGRVPVAVMLNAYEQSLIERKASPGHIRDSLMRVNKYFDSAQVRYFDEIRKDSVLWFRNDIMKKTSARNANAYYNSIRACINRSLDRITELEDRLSPVRGIPILSEENPFRPYLEAKDIDILLSLFYEQKPHLLPIIQGYLFTGMRRNELINLEWADVDFDRCLIRIRHKPFFKPKWGHERNIPILSQMRELLERIDRKADFWVFHSKTGKKLYQYTLYRDFKKVINRSAKLKDLGVDIHLLRHTFCSNLVISGVQLPVVQKVMGHKSIKTTMRYAHLNDSFLVDSTSAVRFKTETPKKVVVKSLQKQTKTLRNITKITPFLAKNASS